MDKIKPKKIGRGFFEFIPQESANVIYLLKVYINEATRPIYHLLPKVDAGLNSAMSVDNPILRCNEPLNLFVLSMLPSME